MVSNSQVLWGPPLIFSGMIGEFYSAASISIAEIIKEIPVINQLSMSVFNELSANNLLTRITPSAGDNAKVQTIKSW